MQSKNLTISVLLALLLVSSLGCAGDAETPLEATQPTLETPALTVPKIAEIGSDSTVFVRVKKADETLSTGSGFVIQKGRIATNHHVIEGIVSGTVESVYNQTRFAIESVLAIDEHNDLAILDAKSFSAPPLSLGDSNKIVTGESVYVVSNPQGWKGTFSDGVISGQRSGGLDWHDGKVFQITAPVFKGSSGGPVLNSRGEVIGIYVGSVWIGQNLNFAIPVNHLRALMETIK